MTGLGFSALRGMLRRGSSPWTPPSASWSRPFGLGWDQPYSVRYASNLDDGPNHGMPLGGFGAGCFGRAPDGHTNLWHLDGGEHWFGTLPDCQFSLWEKGYPLNNFTLAEKTLLCQKSSLQRECNNEIVQRV